MKKRFTEAQITFALRQADSGTPIGEITRKLGIAEATFYRWKKKYAGLGVAEVRRLKQNHDAYHLSLHLRCSFFADLDLSPA